MRPIRRSDFRAHLLIGWWLIWLIISHTALNNVVPPSAAALGHFVLLLAAFTAGFVFIRLPYRVSVTYATNAVISTPATSIKFRWLMCGLSILSLSMLLISLHLAGAFTIGFMEYFVKLRRVTQLDGPLTGIKVLDTLTKAFAFPISYGLILVALGAGVRPFRWVLAICILNFGLFSYLWQINYPIIHLFWLAFFYIGNRYVDGLAINRRALLGLVVACALLFLSAMNRFGSTDQQFFGAVQRYVVGYHLYGFSFYDYQLADPSSILHTPSFGRSSLGFLDHLMEHVARVIGVDYVAASSENAIYNDTSVPIGIAQGHEVNAFGTLAFSLYRDLGVIGIGVGGFIYGAAISYSLLNLRRNWIAASMFYILASAWMMGMMVSPVEQLYFWFCIVFLAAAHLVSRLRCVIDSRIKSDNIGGIDSALMTWARRRA